MKRIAFLSILFAALIEFAVERAKFDLWIVIIAIVPLLWNPVGRALRITREKQLVVGSEHVNEKQLKTPAETASHLESHRRSHAIETLQDSQAQAATGLSDLERKQATVTVR
jgi:hypothetical protein